LTVSRISTVVRHGFTWLHGSSASTQPLDGDTKLADSTSICFADLAATAGALVRTAGLFAPPAEASRAVHAQVTVSSAAMIDVETRNPQCLRGISRSAFRPARRRAPGTLTF
jgi:hypothetical protein